MSKDKLQFLSPLFLKYQSEFEKNPRSRVFAPLAESYRKVGMTDKALDILSQGIRYNPSYVMGYVGLAFCYFEMKQFNLAYSTLRPLVDSNRDNIRLQRLFADVCLQLLRKEEALETLKYLLFLNPRDKEVAEQVSQIEYEVEVKNKPVHNPIIIPEEQLTDNSKTTSLLFDVDKLESTPKIDFDDWLHVDLNAKENKKAAISQIKKESNIDSWNIARSISTEPEETHKVATEVEETRDFFVKPTSEDSKNNLVNKKEKSIEETPIVTHTLVDLYCGQGHIEKALEVLEKILILNPSDQKTKDKILEIKALISPFENDDEIEEENDHYQNDEDSEIDEDQYFFGVDIEQLKDETVGKKTNELIDLDELENVSEEDGRRALMNILDEKVLSNIAEDSTKPLPKFDTLKAKNDKIEKKLSKFLQKIKERALDYQNRF